MTKDKLLDLAKDVGASKMLKPSRHDACWKTGKYIPDGSLPDSVDFTLDQLQAFANLIRKEQIEIDAMICDQVDIEYGGEDVSATWCSSEIRNQELK